MRSAMSRSAPSPAIARSALRSRCRQTERWWRWMSARSSPIMRAAIGRKQASMGRSTSDLVRGLDALDKMLQSGEGPFDLAFVDADKTNYDGYYERVLKLLRAGGLVALDNMLWSGAVADPKISDADTSALRALNAKIHADPRVDMALATVGDGVMLARKR